MNTAKRTVLALGATMIFVAAIGLAADQTNGFGTWRFNETAATIEDLSALYQDESTKWQNPDLTTQCFQLPEPFVVPDPDFYVKHGCLQRHAGRPAVLLMGDSHSASLGVGLRQWAKTQNIDFLQASGFLDPRLFCINQKTRANMKACTAEYAHVVMKTLAATKPDVLVLDMFWSHPETLSGYPNMDAWSKQIQLAIKEIAADLGVKKVIVMGQVPTWQGNLPTLLLTKFVKKHRPIPERTLVAIEPASLQMEAMLQAIKWPEKTQYFSAQKLLCNPDGCLTRVGAHWRTDVVVWDYGHLTEAGSRYVVEHGLSERILQALE